MQELGIDYEETNTCIQMGCNHLGNNYGFCAPHYVKYVFNKLKRDARRLRLFSAENARHRREIVQVSMRLILSGRLPWTWW